MTSQRSPLQPFVKAASIVLIGASPNPSSLAHRLLCNLLAGGFAARLHLVSPRHTTIDGLPCHASLDALAARCSLALIVTPAHTVAATLADCARKGIRAAIIYSSVPREEAAALRRLAAHQGMRLYGPHALGFILPHARLNLTPLIRPVPGGNLALIVQSAAWCAHILDWNHSDESGFSAIFIPGESVDLDLPEILDYLASDPKTESILLYLEGVNDAHRFLSAVRAVASVKPVIAIKAGIYPSSSAIAEAHSGRPNGRDDAFDAALRRAGVLRVRSIGDMFSAARALTTPKKPQGNRLAIVCNGGGPAVLAADLAIERGIVLAELAQTTRDRLVRTPLARWSTGNPVDILFDASPERYAETIAACLADPGVDGVLVILVPTTFTDPLAVAQACIQAAQGSEKPVLACWLGENETRAGRCHLAHQRFPTFRTPESAMTAFAFMVDWRRNQALLQETPPALTSYRAPHTEAARAILKQALDEGRSELTLPEAKEVLSAFHIPVSQTVLATTPTEAVKAADQLGYPLAMKSATPGSPRRVRLHLRSAPEVVLAFRELEAAGARQGVLIEPQVRKPEGRELAINIRTDRVFGPVISLSESGIAAEIYDVRSVALPPLNPRLISEMIGVPHVARLLGPLRGMPAVALAPLTDILLRVSELASELPCVRELNIGSLVADAAGAIVVGAHIAVQPPPPDAQRYAHMAIAPYPSQLASDCLLKDGTACLIRPIRPEDAIPFQSFVRALSTRSKYFRFFNTVSELPQHQLARYTQIDYGRELTLLAIRENDGQQVVLGEAHYATLPDEKSCDFAVVIADDMAGKGLGMRLMNCLMAAARAQGLSSIQGQVLADNEPMLGLMEALDFMVMLTDDESVVEVSRPL